MMVPAAAKLEHRYRGLEMPVSIIAGDGDRIVDTDQQSMRLHEAIDGSELHILPGVGHMVHHSDLEAVLAGMAPQDGLDETMPALVGAHLPHAGLVHSPR